MYCSRIALNSWLRERGGRGEKDKEHNESSLSSCSPGLAHLLPSSIKNIKYGYFIINDTLFPIRVFNCRVILLYKMTLKETERGNEREWYTKEDGSVERMEGETSTLTSQYHLSGVS